MKTHRILAAAFAFVLTLSAHAQNFKTIVASNITDASGAALVSGSLCFQPINPSTQQPSATHPGSSTEIVTADKVCKTINNGAVTAFNMPNPAYSTPTIAYVVSIVNNATHQTTTLGTTYISDQDQSTPGGATWDVDHFQYGSTVALPTYSQASTVGSLGTSTLSVGGVANFAGNAAFGGTASFMGALTGSVANFSSAITAPLLHGQADSSITSEKWSTLPQSCPAGYFSNAQDINGNFLNCTLPNGATSSTSGTQNAALNPAGSQMITVPSGSYQRIGSAASYMQVDSQGDVQGQQIAAAIGQFRGPKVDVTYPGFASGSGIAAHPGQNCVGVDGNPNGIADNTLTYNSECALRNAATYAIWTTFGSMHPTLYFPGGGAGFLVNVSGLTGVFVFNNAYVSVTGDGETASLIKNTSPQAALFTWLNDYGISLTGLTLSGNGHTSTGDLVDLVGTVAAAIHGDRFLNVGGIPINLQGASERNRIWDVNVSNSPMAYNSEANTNEDYIHDFDFTFNGYTGDNWYYTSNANPLTGVLWTNACPSGTPTAWANGSTVAQGALASYNGMEFVSLTNNNSTVPQKWSSTWNACALPIVPEDRPVVYLDGDNESIAYGSIKGTQMSGINAARTTMSLFHVYLEGDSSGTVTTLNYAFQSVGKMEVGHGMSALAANGLTATVDDAMWQHEYVTDPSLLSYLATDNGTGIFPADYNQLDCSASAYAPVLKCQYESVAMYGYSNDGLAHISQRAVNGSVAPGVACSGSTTTNCGAGAVNAAVAWPAPTTNSIGWTQPSWVISQLPNSTYGVVTAQNNHFEMVHLASNHNVNASDTTLQPFSSQWVGSPSLASADFFVGPVPDGYSMPFPSQSIKGYSTVSGSVHFIDNAMFSNTDPLNEELGLGYAKVLAGGIVTISQSNPPVQNYVPAATAFSVYRNGFTQVLFNPDATGVLTDESAHYFMTKGASASSIYNYFKADYQTAGGGNGLSTEILGGLPYCTSYDSSTSTAAQPAFRECLVNGGWQLQAYNSSSSSYQNLLGVNASGQFSGQASLLTPSNQKISGNTTISTASTNVFLDGSAGNVTATLPTCASGTNIGTTFNLFRADVSLTSTVVISSSSTDMQIDGTTTNSSQGYSVGMPLGANWVAVCDSTVNSYAEWRIYTQKSGVAPITGALASGVSGSLGLSNSSNTMSGSANLSLSSPVGASASLVVLTFPTYTHIASNACFASTAGATGVTLPIQIQSNIGLTIYAPAGGLVAGNYAVQYQCGR